MYDPTVEYTKENELLAYKYIVVHCKDEEEQNLFTSNTQLSVVGNFLCSRARKKREVWVTKLKDRTEDSIQESILEYEPGSEPQYYKSYESRALNIQRLVEKSDIKHI